MKLRTLLLLCLIPLPMAMWADSFSVDNIKYGTLSSSTVQVTGLEKGYPSWVKIPGTVTNGGTTYTVVQIGKDAFEDCTFHKISIPSTVNTICRNAFYDSDTMDSLIIEDSPNRLYLNYDDNWIDDGLFWECDKLKFVYMGRDLSHTDDANDEPRAFYKHRTLEEVVVGPQVTYIEGSLFKESNLKDIDFSNALGLKTIWEEAFRETNIANAVIMPNVEEISYRAFYDCDKLNVVIIQESDLDPLKFRLDGDKENEAFGECNNLALLQLNRDITYDTSSLSENDWNSTVAGQLQGNMILSPFYDSYLATIQIGDKVTEILPYEFECCNKTQSIYIGSSVKTIGYGAFKECDALADVSFGDGEDPVTIYPICHFNSSLGGETDSSPFEDSPVTTIHMGRTINDYRGDYQLIDDDHVEKLTSLYIARTVSSVGIYQFHNCKALTSLTIDGEATRIKSNAFLQCYGLTSVTIAGTPTIETDAFKDCSNISTLYFAGQPAAIANNAFWGCGNIKKVDVSYHSDPDSIGGKDAFLVANNKWIYDQAVLENVMDDAGYRADFSNSAPWRYFTQRTEFVPTPISAFTEAGITGNEPDTLATVSLYRDFVDTTYTLISFPFNVDSYYFGSDAIVYTLDLFNNDAVKTDAGYQLTRFDIDANTEFPVNVPLLVNAPRGENWVQSPLNLFEQKYQKVVQMDVNEDGWGVFKGASSGVTALTEQKMKTFSYDANSAEFYYKVVDGILKRINRDCAVEAFAGVLYNDSSVIMNLVDENGNQIVRNGFNVTPNQYLLGYSTFYSAETACELVGVDQDGKWYKPDVYTIIDVDGVNLTLDRVDDGIVNAGEAVLIKGQPGVKIFLRAVLFGSFDVDAYDNNVLKGVDKDTPVADLCSDGIYVLSCNSSYTHTGFYHYGTDKTLQAHKAYLDPAKVDVDVKCFSLTLPEETNIETMTTNQGDGKIYDLNGRQVSNTNKRQVYIIDNKKIIKK